MKPKWTPSLFFFTSLKAHRKLNAENFLLWYGRPSHSYHLPSCQPARLFSELSLSTFSCYSSTSQTTSLSETQTLCAASNLCASSLPCPDHSFFSNLTDLWQAFESNITHLVNQKGICIWTPSPLSSHRSLHTTFFHHRLSWILIMNCCISFP